VKKKKEMVVDEGISYRRRAMEKNLKKDTSNLQRRRGTHTHVQSTQTPPAPHVRTREAKHTTFFFSFLSRVISFQLGSRIFAFGAIFACVTNRCAISPFVSIFFRASWGNHHVAPVVSGGDPKYSRTFTILELTS
jgi:hypothetical protein